MTGPGMVLGSPQFVAPERARDGVSDAAYRPVVAGRDPLRGGRGAVPVRPGQRDGDVERAGHRAARPGAPGRPAGARAGRPATSRAGSTLTAAETEPLRHAALAASPPDWARTAALRRTGRGDPPRRTGHGSPPSVGPQAPRRDIRAAGDADRAGRRQRPRRAAGIGRRRQPAFGVGSRQRHRRRSRAAGIGARLERVRPTGDPTVAGGGGAPPSAGIALGRGGRRGHRSLAASGGAGQPARRSDPAVRLGRRGADPPGRRPSLRAPRRPRHPGGGGVPPPSERSACAGWTWYDDPTGFRIAAPVGWLH